MSKKTAQQKLADLQFDQIGFPSSIELNTPTGATIAVSRERIKQAITKVARDEQNLIYRQHGLRFHPNLVGVIVTSWIAECSNLALQDGPAKPRLVIAGQS